MQRIPVAEPALVGNERKYVLDCLETGWISSVGKYVEEFEREFSRFCGVRHAMACANGTTALHLALLAIGIGPGDEVIVPALTFVATANAVKYCGAKPVFVDSDPWIWTMDPMLIGEKVSSRTKAIIAVHIYGHPVDMDPIRQLAQQRELFVIEDAAEAHGAEYGGKRVGGIGHVGTFSFYGNKIMTTGEGGMVVTDDEEIARRVRMFRGQGMDPSRKYWFPVIGYNYRMTNISAAIGLAQLERIEWHLSRRRQIAGWYYERLGNRKEFDLQPEMHWARNVYWMVSLALTEALMSHRDDLRFMLAEDGIETRPFFYPMHQLPMYELDSQLSAFPVAESLAQRGINLPTSALLSQEQVEFVCNRLLSSLSRIVEAQSRSDELRA